jgi:Kef-type K+ transport system membrane component KefB
MEDRAWYKQYFLNFFLIICILQILDFATTWYMAKTIGISIEMNPFIRFLLGYEMGNYLIAITKIVAMIFYFLVGWWWVNHPIRFYKRNEQIVFQLIPILFWFVYSVVVALNLLGIIYMESYL